MTLRTVLALVVLGAAMAPVAARPQSDDAAAQQMINDPNPATFQVYGVSPPPKSVKDTTVQGGRALPVSTPGGGTPYAVGVNVPLTRPVKAGDKLLMMFYAKLAKPAPGAATAKVAAQIQLLGAPYTPVFGKSVDVPAEWKLFQVDGKADKDYAKGALGAAFHLNSGKQVIAMGIVAVFDQGQ